MLQLPALPGKRLQVLRDLRGGVQIKQVVFILYVSECGHISGLLFRYVKEPKPSRSPTRAICS